MITEKKYYPWLLVISYSLLGLTFPAAVTQFSMITNEMAKAIGSSSQIVLMADTLRAIMLVIGMFLSSIIYRKIGLRKTMFVGIIFQAGSQLLIPLAIQIKCLPLFFVFKGMQGLNAIAFPLYISTITLWIEERYKGLATAIFNGSFIAGGGIGAWISGIIIPAFGWKLSFYIIGGMCLVFSIPVFVITRDKEITSEKIIKRDTKKNKMGSRYKAIVKNPITWFLVIALIANTWVSQAINVDMSVYAQDIGYDYAATGSLMLIISVLTIVSSVMAGGVSDWIAERFSSPIKSRCIIMAVGYLLAVVSSVLLPVIAGKSFWSISLAATAMMFGVSWAAGVFWALPSEIYDTEQSVEGTSFCSAASNIPNPIAPAVVGVLLGTRGLWNVGWMTCAIVSALSLVASLLIAKQTKSKK